MTLVNNVTNIWPCKGQSSLGKSKGNFTLTKLFFCRKNKIVGKSIETMNYTQTVTRLQKANSVKIFTNPLSVQKQI